MDEINQMDINLHETRLRLCTMINNATPTEVFLRDEAPRILDEIYSNVFPTILERNFDDLYDCFNILTNCAFYGLIQDRFTAPSIHMYKTTIDPKAREEIMYFLTNVYLDKLLQAHHNEFMHECLPIYFKDVRALFCKIVANREWHCHKFEKFKQTELGILTMYINDYFALEKNNKDVFMDIFTILTNLSFLDVVRKKHVEFALKLYPTTSPELQYEIIWFLNNVYLDKVGCNYIRSSSANFVDEYIIHFITNYYTIYPEFVAEMFYTYRLELVTRTNVMHIALQLVNTVVNSESNALYKYFCKVWNTSDVKQLQDYMVAILPSNPSLVADLLRNSHLQCEIVNDLAVSLLDDFIQDSSTFKSILTYFESLQPIYINHVLENPKFHSIINRCVHTSQYLYLLSKLFIHLTVDEKSYTYFYQRFFLPIRHLGIFPFYILQTLSNSFAVLSTLDPDVLVSYMTDTLTRYCQDERLYMEIYFIFQLLPHEYYTHFIHNPEFMTALYAWFSYACIDPHQSDRRYVYMTISKIFFSISQHDDLHYYNNTPFADKIKSVAHSSFILEHVVTRYMNCKLEQQCALNLYQNNAITFEDLEALGVHLHLWA